MRVTKRPTLAMPNDVRTALKVGAIEADYQARSPYQRNDYIGWVTRAKQTETRRKRIEQMVEELQAGGVYMGMKHAPSAKGRN
jgi:uncharacterized protein YdeI (YjbR/CyaY-like superfamily)